MGIDRPGDGDMPPDEPPRQPGQDGQARFETRSRQEYYDELRAAVTADARNAPGQEGAAGTGPRARDGKPWTEVTAWSGRVWAEYQRKFAPEEGAGRAADGRRPGRAAGEETAGEETDRECDQIAGREQRRITPALLETESRDPDRQLVGFEYRLKGRDRIKEKVAEGMEEAGLTAKEAISLIPDAIRYTFQYEEACYTQGVHGDIARLKEHGFDMTALKNSWDGEQYKGINSRWIEPDSGQRFEVQFHTKISFEAKQITHAAYERLRSGKADEFERMVLRAFQREVSAEIPVPSGAPDIPDYP